MSSSNVVVAQRLYGKCDFKSFSGAAALVAFFRPVVSVCELRRCGLLNFDTRKPRAGPTCRNLTSAVDIQSSLSRNSGGRNGYPAGKELHRLPLAFLLAFLGSLLNERQWRFRGDERIGTAPRLAADGGCGSADGGGLKAYFKF